jgi:hypothetical protein
LRGDGAENLVGSLGREVYDVTEVKARCHRQNCSRKICIS